MLLAAAALVTLVTSPVPNANITDFSLTSLCRPATDSAQLRIRNQSDSSYEFVLEPARSHLPEEQRKGVSRPATDIYIVVEWNSADDAWRLKISDYSYEVKIGDVGLCVSPGPTKVPQPPKTPVPPKRPRPTATDSPQPSPTSTAPIPSPSPSELPDTAGAQFPRILGLAVAAIGAGAGLMAVSTRRRRKI